MEPTTPNSLGLLVHVCALLALVVAAAFHVDLAQPVTDAFQEAEYTTIGPLERLHPDMRMPVLIHGGMDVYPSRLAARFCPGEAQVVCVRTINTTVQVLAGCLLVALLAAVAGLGSQAALIASVPVAASFWLFGGPALLAADAQQGAPGIRDVGPLLALLVMARLCAQLDRRRPTAGGLELVLLGALAAASPFWVYNRGVVTIVVAGLSTLMLCLARGSLRPALLSALGALAALAAVFALAGPHLVADTVSDIRYWAADAELWRIPLQLRGVLPTLALDGIAMAVAIPPAWSALRAGRPGGAVMIVALIATGVLYTLQSVSRSDLIHMRWTVWPAALVLAIGIRARLDGLRSDMRPGGGFQVAVVLLALLCLETLSDRSIAYGTFNGLMRTARLLRQPLARDRDLVSPGMRRMADLVRSAGGCTFAANNAGIVHLLSGVPPCSRFMFGAYIAPDRQDAVIAELEAAAPEIILWSAPDWWAHIDGHTFGDRSPRLTAWIVDRFPVETSIGPYTVRSRDDLVPTP